MPNPKRRHSKARRDKRRTHDSLSRPGLTTCAHCGETKIPHRVCLSCGHYRGREVIEAKDEL